MASRPSYHAEGSPSERLKALRLRLPEPPKAASPFYVPYAVVGDIIYISGQLPTAEDGSLLTGKVVQSTNVVSDNFVSLDAGKRAAKACALNILSLLQKELGSLDNVARIVKLFIMVNCSNEFKEPHVVANGCSDVFIQIFGDAGRSARSAVGQASLPFGVTVEVEAIVEIARQARL